MMTSKGIAQIKPEFIVELTAEQKGNSVSSVVNQSVEEQLDAKSSSNNAPQQQHHRQKRNRGMDHQREQKMSRARAEVRERALRICPSVLFPDAPKACKFGNKCTAEHSREQYWAQKPPDLGPDCYLFDQQGKCPFSLACCFARAHTNAEYLSQIEKKPAPIWQPTINVQTLGLQMQLRKHNYDFRRADNAVRQLTAQKKESENNTQSEAPTPIISAMEREAPRLNMREACAGKKYLAPLTTVGNLPFRRLCVELGADITCGEMAMATHILQGMPSELSLLKRHPSEKLFGVQLAGGYPDTLSRAVQLIKENFQADFIDLNLGCPLDAVNDKGGGCTLANRSNKLTEVLQCMQQTAGDIPITMKMRYGMKEGQRTAHMTMGTILKKGAAPQLFTLHPRSRDQRYTRAAEWDYVEECARVIDGRFPFFVSGDILCYEDYYHHLSTYPIDGIMIGRGALVKPWIFTEIDERRDWDISSTERFDLMKKFVHYGLEHWGSDVTGVETTRRFLLEWLSFQYRYIPVGLLQEPPQRINERPQPYRGRDDLETLLASPASSDWVRISEMLLGKTPDGFCFVPKHRANAY